MYLSAFVVAMSTWSAISSVRPLPLHFNKSKMAVTAMLEKFQVAISTEPVVLSTSCFVLWRDFRGRRI